MQKLPFLPTQAMKLRRCNRPAMSKLDENKPLRNASKRFQHYIYLPKLHIDYSIANKNNLTKICCKISKVGMNL